MWQVDNRTPFAAERGWVRDRDGAEVWLVAVKASFDILPDGSTVPSAEQPPVLRVPAYFGDPATSSIRYEADLVLTKTTTDVLLVGNAHAPGGQPVTELDVGFRVGALQKQIRAVGERGGMIGVNSIGAFVSADGRSGPDLIANHIDHIVQLIGPEHVGLGLDVVFYQDFMLKLYDSGPMMAARGYPRPPWDDIKPEALPALVAALRSRGYDDTTLRNILGGNFLRIAAANWT